MTEQKAKRPNYKFLDGMRGIAAMTVVLYHAYLFTGMSGDAERGLSGVNVVVPAVGSFGVPMFIVLSGFVLMLPIANRPDLTMGRSTWGYLKRRARRILPPYYASLALFIGIILLVPVMGQELGTEWDSKIPITWDGLFAHVFVIHNLSTDWAFQINGPAWSIATEWQLYFALPFLLLPIWRRTGRMPMLVVAVVVGLGLTFLFPNTGGGRLWYLSLFALGMLAAEAVVRKRKVPELTLLVALSWTAAILLTLTSNRLSELVGSAPMLIVTELMIGVAIALLVIWLARQHQSPARRMRKILESKFLVWMGLWSYSLYLIHSPILALSNLLLINVEMSIWLRFAIQLLVAMPVAAACAYLFHRLVERRFMTSHQQQVQAQELEPART